MGVHVVGAVLRVVLEDEDGRLRPEAALRDGLDEPAEGDVVLGHHRARGERSRPRPVGVVAAEVEDVEAGQAAVLLEAPELLEPGVDALVVRDVEIEGRERGVDLALEARHRGPHGTALRVPGGELAVAPDGDAGAVGEVPEVAAGGRGDVPVGVPHSVTRPPPGTGLRVRRSSWARASRSRRSRRPPSSRSGRRGSPRSRRRSCRRGRTRRRGRGRSGSPPRRRGSGSGRRCPSAGRRGPGRRCGSRGSRRRRT